MCCPVKIKKLAIFGKRANHLNGGVKLLFDGHDDDDEQCAVQLSAG